MQKHVSVVYFSPTGNTQKTVQAMAEALSNESTDLDLTCRAQHHQFNEDDCVILGMPVYGGRIPIVARQRLEGVHGRNTPCLVVVSYGNRDYDDALLELSTLATEQGFLVKGAAAVVGRHTYGEIQVTRPDEADLKQDRAFARAAAAKPSNAPAPHIPGHTPYKDGGKGGTFSPLTSDACTQCGLCIRECPVQAIQEDCVTISDACIACFRCIRNCPVHAKNMETREYTAFAAMFTQKLQERRENSYFV